MAKLHLSYDGNQNNGIVFNDTYTLGALYTGISNKPSLSFTYDSMQYSEVFTDSLDYVDLAGTKKVMTDEQKAEVKALALTWVQPLGQEGNPTEEQQLETAKALGSRLITEHIMIEITSYNLANGTDFTTVHNCESYSRVAGYTHQNFCLAVWLWNVEVFEYMRLWQGTLTVIPTEAEILAELATVPILSY